VGRVKDAIIMAVEAVLVAEGKAEDHSEWERINHMAMEEPRKFLAEYGKHLPAELRTLFQGVR